MTRYTCLHLIQRSGVCTDPALADEPVTWCADRGDCAVKTEARQRHIATLLRIPGRQQRADYIDTVRSAEGAGSADNLKAAFAAAWSTK